jgi:hypothetical protein
MGAAKKTPFDRDHGKCRSCGEPIWWAMTEAAKLMPVDGLPSEDGTLFVFIPTDPTVHLRAVHMNAKTPEVADAHREHRPRFKSHFATCPNAGQHRKAKP